MPHTNLYYSVLRFTNKTRLSMEKLDIRQHIFPCVIFLSTDTKSKTLFVAKTPRVLPFCEPECSREFYPPVTLHGGGRPRALELHSNKSKSVPSYTRVTVSLPTTSCRHRDKDLL